MTYTFAITTWDGNIELSFYITAESREEAIRRAKGSHYERYGVVPYEVHAHKA